MSLALSERWLWRCGFAVRVSLRLASAESKSTSVRRHGKHQGNDGGVVSPRLTYASTKVRPGVWFGSIKAQFSAQKAVLLFLSCVRRDSLFVKYSLIHWEEVRNMKK